MSTPENFRIQLPPSITLTEIDSRTVLFSKSTGDFYGLNPAAAFLLRTLADSDFQTTVKTASASFVGVEAERISTDLVSMVDELTSLGLIERIDDSSPANAAKGARA